MCAVTCSFAVRFVWSNPQIGTRRSERKVHCGEIAHELPDVRARLYPRRRQLLVGKLTHKYDISNCNLGSVFLLITRQITPHAGTNNGMWMGTRMPATLRSRRKSLMTGSSNNTLREQTEIRSQLYRWQCSYLQIQHHATPAAC